MGMQHMKGIIFGLLFVVLAAAALALEGTRGEVHIYGPLDNAVVKTPSQEFIFSIEAPENAKECTIYVDDQPMKTFAEIERRLSTKFTLSLSDGGHVWNIACTLLDDTTLASPARNITISTASASSNCVAKLYKGQGAYRYVFTAGCIKNNPVVIKDLAASDWIEFWPDVAEKFAPKKPVGSMYVIYMTKLASRNDEWYVQFFTSKDKTRVDVSMNETANLDAIGDAEKDLSFTLNDVVRKKAKVTISLIGAAAAQNPTANEVPNISGNAPAQGTTPDTADTNESEQNEGSATHPTSTGVPATEVNESIGEDIIEPKGDPTKLYVTIVIIVILAIIVIYLAFSNKNGKKKDDRKRKIEDKEEKMAEEELPSREERREERKAGKEDSRGKHSTDFMIEGKRKK